MRHHGDPYEDPGRPAEVARQMGRHPTLPIGHPANAPRKRDAVVRAKAAPAPAPKPPTAPTRYRVEPEPLPGLIPTGTAELCALILAASGVTVLALGLWAPAGIGLLVLALALEWRVRVARREIAAAHLAWLLADRPEPGEEVDDTIHADVICAETCPRFPGNCTNRRATCLLGEAAAWPPWDEDDPAAWDGRPAWAGTYQSPIGELPTAPLLRDQHTGRHAASGPEGVPPPSLTDPRD